MSYLGPSPRPPATGDRPATAGRPMRPDGRPRMARRGRAWPTGSRRPGCQPVPEGNQPTPASNRPALAGKHTSARRQHTSARRQHTGTRQRPVLKATGQHSRQLGMFCQVWGLGSLSSFSCLRAGRLGAYRGREAADRAVPAIAAQVITNTGGPDGGSGRTQDAGIPPARTPEGGRQGWGEGAICRKPALHHSDPAMAADRQPAPFWANHSSTRCMMSEPRTAPAFQLTWQ